MPQQVFGAEAAVSMVNRALANTSPAHTVYLNQVAAAGTTDASQYAFAAQLGAQYAVGKTAADLSALLLGNMGVSNDILQAALTDYIAFHGTQNIGIIALQLGQILSGLEGDVTFGAAAAAWNQEVTNAYQYSSSPNNNTPQTGDDGANTTKLSRFTDVLTGKEFSGYLDYNQFTGRDEQTLTTGDRLTGTDATDDVLFAQLNGGTTTPTLKGIELVSIDAKATSTLNLANADGVTTVLNVNTSEGLGLTFSNLKNLVDVVIKNTNSSTTVNFNASVVAGQEDKLNLVLDGAGVAAARADFVTAGVEELSIKAENNASFLASVTNAQLKKVVITGDQNLTVGTKAVGAATAVVAGAVVVGNGFSSTNLESLDASAATGNLFLNIEQSAARDQTVKTGAGNDVVVTGILRATDTFDLGAGNDRLVLTNVNSNQAAKLVGVEEVEARAALTNLNLTSAPDVKLLAVAEGAGFANVTAVKSGTQFVFEGAGLANAASNSAVNFGGVNYNLAAATGATDVIDFNFKNAGIALGAGSTVTIGTVGIEAAAVGLNNTGNNVETLNLNFSDVGAASQVIVADIDGNALKALSVKSDGKVTLNNVADLTALTSVDATGVDKGFTATFGNLGAAAAATIKLGGSGVNNLSVGKANASGTASHTLLTVDGSAGTGNQSIVITGNADTPTAAPAANTAVDHNAKASVAVLGGSGNDSITVTSTPATTVNLINGGAGADTINLTASVGIDVVQLTAGSSSSANKDTITAFATTKDKVDLSSFGFDVALQNVNLAAAALNGTANEFTVGGVTAAAYFDTAAKVLYVDVNGDNKLDASDLVVNFTGITGGANVVAGDIFWA